MLREAGKQRLSWNTQKNADKLSKTVCQGTSTTPKCQKFYVSVRMLFLSISCWITSKVFEKYVVKAACSLLIYVTP